MMYVKVVMRLVLSDSEAVFKAVKSCITLHCHILEYIDCNWACKVYVNLSCTKL